MNFFKTLLVSAAVAVGVSVVALNAPMQPESTHSPPSSAIAKEQALKSALNATVHIVSTSRVDDKGAYGMGQGSGYIVAVRDGRAIIATNCHVACNNTWLRIATYNNPTKRVNARFITGDQTQDTAFISVPFEPGMEVVPFLDVADMPILGETAIATGAPLGVTFTVTEGIISSANREDRDWSTLRTNVHQTDTAINPGNSGGPLMVLRDGRYVVAGMNTFIMSRAGGSNGLGFAVSSHAVKSALDAVLDGRPVLQNSIGGAVTNVDSTMADIINRPEAYADAGLYVNGVAENGALAQAGIQEGDVLLKMDGEALKSPAMFRSAVLNTKLYQPVELVYLRDGEVLETVAFIQNTWGSGVTRNKVVSSSTAEAPEDEGPLAAFGFGHVMDNTDKKYRRTVGFRNPETSPVVLEITEQSAAHHAGINKGAFLKSIGFKGMAPTAVETLEDVRTLFAAAEDEGIDTSKAVFHFVMYAESGPRKLPPVALDVNNVPSPA